MHKRGGGAFLEHMLMKCNKTLIFWRVSAQYNLHYLPFSSVYGPIKPFKGVIHVLRLLFFSLTGFMHSGGEREHLLCLPGYYILKEDAP